MSKTPVVRNTATFGGLGSFRKLVIALQWLYDVMSRDSMYFSRVQDRISSAVRFGRNVKLHRNNELQ